MGDVHLGRPTSPHTDQVARDNSRAKSTCLILELAPIGWGGTPPQPKYVWDWEKRDVSELIWRRLAGPKIQLEIVRGRATVGENSPQDWLALVGWRDENSAGT